MLVIILILIMLVYIRVVESIRISANKDHGIMVSSEECERCKKLLDAGETYTCRCASVWAVREFVSKIYGGLDFDDNFIIVDKTNCCEGPLVSIRRLPR